MAEPAERTNVTELRKTEAGAASALAGVPHDRKSRRQAVRWTLLILGPLLVLLGIGWFWLTGGRYVGTDNAYVQADLVSVATDVGGLVKAVAVRDNQPVRRGDVLFTLDDSSYRNALASAAADLALAKAELEALKASHAESLAAIAKAEADVAFYEKDYQRQLDLTNRRVAAQSQLDAAQHDLATARNEVAALRQKLAGIAAQLGGDPNAPVERHPRYQAALAARDQAARNLDHTSVKAPMDSVTAQVSALQPGEYLEAGQAAMALVATDHVWIEANPKETDLTFVRPDQPVAITVDTYPGREWEGTVASLSPASQAQFSLLPAQNTSGNWVKVVQRIPVRIRVETRPGEPQLRAGMSAEIEIDTGHQRHLRDLFAWL
jgi:membrane fusion protein (multidrug efflux system)